MHTSTPPNNNNNNNNNINNSHTRGPKSSTGKHQLPSPTSSTSSTTNSPHTDSPHSNASSHHSDLIKVTSFRTATTTTNTNTNKPTTNTTNKPTTTSKRHHADHYHPTEEQSHFNPLAFNAFPFFNANNSPTNTTTNRDG